MLHFYKTCLNLFNISSLSSVGIAISLTGFLFTIQLSFDLVTASGVLFPNNSPALWTTFLEAVLKESGPVFNNCFLYLFDKFLPNDKNPHLLTYFLVLGSIEQHVISITNKQGQINFVFYF